MSKLKETVQTTSLTIILTMLGTALVTMLGTIWLAIQNPLVNLINEKVPKIILLLFPIILSLLLIIAISYIIFLHKKIKNPTEDYEFDQNTGILRNPKDKLSYCLSCLHKGIKSPLKVQENGWICLNKDCNMFYNNPDYKAPSFQPIRSRRNWVTDW